MASTASTTAVKRSAIHLGKEALKRISATFRTNTQSATSPETAPHTYIRPGGIKRIVHTNLFRAKLDDGTLLQTSKPTITAASQPTKGIATTQVITRRSGSDKMVVFIGLTSCLSAYVFWKTNREEVFLNKTGRLRTMALSWDTERKLTRLMDSTISREEFESEFGWILPASDFRNQEITAIASQIIRSGEEDFFEIRKRLDWTVTVCENMVPNAFCSMGGSVTVFSGLFQLFVEAERQGIIKDARNGIACILAHEIAHGFCRHTTERISWLPLEYPLSYIIEDERWLQIILKYVVNLPYSRQCETKADLVGLELMARAGFDPREVPKYFQLLDDTPASLEWTSTHPSGETRAKIIQERLPEAIALYELNKYRFSPPPPPDRGFFSWLKNLLSVQRIVTGRIPLSELEDREAVKRSMLHVPEQKTKGPAPIEVDVVRASPVPSRIAASVTSSVSASSFLGRKKADTKETGKSLIPRHNSENDSIA